MKIAYATIEAAWTAGVRYYDTSPWYGLGLAERRLGTFLHKQNRSEYLLSSKVGKLLTASRNNNAKEYFPFTPSPNNLRYDYTADGIKRSIEDSLQRLGVDALDVVFVHDLSPDNPWLPGPWEEQFEIARKGAFPALSKMRDEGVIKGWGLGVNSPEPILKLMDVADANVCLLARQYSFIDHGNALREVFPKARERGMAFVVGSSLNAGFLSGSRALQLRQGELQDSGCSYREARPPARDCGTPRCGPSHGRIAVLECAGRRGRARCRLRDSAAGARGLHVARDENPACVLVRSSIGASDRKRRRHTVLKLVKASCALKWVGPLVDETR